MRAATTYGFGRLNGLGDLVWHKSEISNKMVGNPSISTLVTMYMHSLQKRKVQSGETPSSARAVTAVRALISRVYLFSRMTLRNSKTWKTCITRTTCPKIGQSSLTSRKNVERRTFIVGAEGVHVGCFMQRCQSHSFAFYGLTKSSKFRCKI